MSHSPGRQLDEGESRAARGPHSENAEGCLKSSSADPIGSIDWSMRTRPLTNGRWARRPSLLSGALVALLAGLLPCGMAPAAGSMVTPVDSPCWGSSDARPRCAAIAATTGEGEEGEEESEEGEAGAASAEAMAEESSASSNSQATNSGSSGNVVLSRLKLTATAMAALKHRRPSASTVRFSFTLNVPVRVHVTLVKQTNGVGAAGKRWTMLPNSLLLSAGQGRVERSLTGHNRLSPGRYRLTVKPTNGASRSIYLSIPG